MAEAGEECSWVVINMYVKCAASHVGHKVFDETPERDVISWSVLILGYG